MLKMDCIDKNKQKKINVRYCMYLHKNVQCDSAHIVDGWIDGSINQFLVPFQTMQKHSKKKLT